MTAEVKTRNPEFRRSVHLESCHVSTIDMDVVSTLRELNAHLLGAHALGGLLSPASQCHSISPVLQPCMHELPATLHAASAVKHLTRRRCYEEHMKLPVTFHIMHCVVTGQQHAGNGFCAEPTLLVAQLVACMAARLHLPGASFQALHCNVLRIIWMTQPAQYHESLQQIQFNNACQKVKPKTCFQNF